jgi:hypothetical protein
MYNNSSYAKDKVRYPEGDTNLKHADVIMLTHIIKSVIYVIVYMAYPV